MTKIKNGGFSLLEILIYVTIIAVVTLAISKVFLSLAQGQAKADVRAEINSNIRFALDKINQDVLSASAITTPATAGSTANSLVMTVSATTITYCVANNQIRRSAGGICDGTAEPITSSTIKVDNLTFTRLENTNTVLPKTIISIQTVLAGSYNGINPNYQYTITKQITSSLR